MAELADDVLDLYGDEELVLDDQDSRMKVQLPVTRPVYGAPKLAHAGKVA
jgi:hypothetical protein